MASCSPWDGSAVPSLPGCWQMGVFQGRERVHSNYIGPKVFQEHSLALPAKSIRMINSWWDLKGPLNFAFISDCWFLRGTFKMWPAATTKSWSGCYGCIAGLFGLVLSTFLFTVAIQCVTENNMKNTRFWLFFYSCVPWSSYTRTHRKNSIDWTS